jgi:hypothetical protein
MTYLFSEYLDGFPEKTFGKIYLYGDTETLDSDLNCRQPGGTENAYTGSALTLVESGITNSGNATYEFSREETLTITMDTLVIFLESDVFTDGDGEATINFCVRYALYTGDYTDPNNFEVNFVETLVTLLVDLSDDFSIMDITVGPRDKLKRTANQEYNLEGFQCSGKTAEGGIPKVEDGTQFNQGDVVTVCVQPNADARGEDVYMREVEFFRYILLEEDGITESNTGQLAIDINNAAAGARGAMYGLTNIDTCEGEVACVIETILFAAFYTRPGTITGAGTGIMQFGTEGADGVRKLGGTDHRSLQEDGAASGEFSVKVFLDNTGYDPFLSMYGRSDGATDIRCILALVVGSAATVLLLWC